MSKNVKSISKTLHACLNHYTSSDTIRSKTNETFEPLDVPSPVMRSDRFQSCFMTEEKQHHKKFATHFKHKLKL